MGRRLLGALLNENPDEPRHANGSALVRGLDRFDHGIGAVEHIVALVALVLLAVVGSGQAILLKVQNSGWEWSDEIIRCCVFFIAMSGAALAAQGERQIAMDVLAKRLRPRAQAWLRIVTRTFTGAMCIILLIAGLKVAETSAGSYHFISPHLRDLALPLGCGLIALHMLVHNVIDILYLGAGKLPPEPGGQAVH